MTPSERAAVAAALARMSVALDRCLLLARWRHPMPPPAQWSAGTDQREGGDAHG